MASRYEIEVKVTVSSVGDLNNANRRRGPTRPSNKYYGEPLKRTPQRTPQPPPRQGLRNRAALPRARPVPRDSLRGPAAGRQTLRGPAAQPVLRGGYSYGSYNAPPRQRRYGQPSYGQAPRYGYGGEQAPAYGGQYGREEKKKSKFGGMGMGTGLAVGAVAGALRGMAVAERFDNLEDEISDDSGYDAQPSYGQAPAYGGQYGREEKEKSKFGGMGMGTGLAVGAVAAALGGMAVAEGFDNLEDEISDDGGYDEDDF